MHRILCYGGHRALLSYPRRGVAVFNVTPHDSAIGACGIMAFVVEIKRWKCFVGVKFSNIVHFFEKIIKLIDLRRPTCRQVLCELATSVVFQFGIDNTLY